MDGLRKKHGPLRYYPQKTTFNPDIHFKLAYIFENCSADGKHSEVPKIPPLRKEPQGNRHKANAALTALNKNFGLSIDLKQNAMDPSKSDSDDDSNGIADGNLKLKIYL